MTAPPRRLRIGPASGELLVRTQRAGLAASVGHDLTIVATRWSGVVSTGDDPASSQITVEVDLGSLAVRDGTGGAVPLTDRDRSQINDTMQRILTPSGTATARFVASAVTVGGDGDPSVDGVLRLHGVDHPVRLTITRTGADRFHGSATVAQSAYGIKPYSAMFGALKLRDEVRVEFDVDLDAAETLSSDTPP